MFFKSVWNHHLRLATNRCYWVCGHSPWTTTTREFFFHHRPQFTSVSLMLLLPCCFRVKKLHDVRNDWNVIFGKPLKSIHVVLKNPKYKGVNGSTFKSTFNFAYLSVIWWRQPIDCCIYFLARSGEKMIEIFALGLPPADHHVFPCQDLLKTSFSGQDIFWYVVQLKQGYCLIRHDRSVICYLRIDAVGIFKQIKWTWEYARSRPY